MFDKAEILLTQTDVIIFCRREFCYYMMFLVEESILPTDVNFVKKTTHFTNLLYNLTFSLQKRVVFTYVKPCSMCINPPNSSWSSGWIKTTAQACMRRTTVTSLNSTASCWRLNWTVAAEVCTDCLTHSWPGYRTLLMVSSQSPKRRKVRMRVCTSIICHMYLHPLNICIGVERTYTKHAYL